MAANLRCKIWLTTLLLIFTGMASCMWASNAPRNHGGSPPSGNTKPASIVYVALGDSTGRGVGARSGLGYVERLLLRIQQTHDPRARVINLCQVGATTGNVLREQLSSYPKTSPTLVTFVVGVNDLLMGEQPEQFGNNYEEVIKRLKSSKATIIVANIPDLSFAPTLPKSMRKEMSHRTSLFNKIIEEIAKRHEIMLVDLFGMSAKVISSHPEFFSQDGFHPSDAGYELWVEVMWPTVETAIR